MSQHHLKDFLLKSSLPLEHAVSTMFSSFEFFSWGEYAYERTDEASNKKEFTVDLHCFKEYNRDNEWLATLDLLVECKYSSPGVKWIFAPHPEKSQIFPRVLRHHDGLTGKKIEFDFLNHFEKQFCECIRGVSIHNSGFDPSVISTAANQVRYALPHVVTRSLSSLLDNRESLDLDIRFFAGVIVTNAPLYILRNFSSLEGVENSDNVEDVCENVKSLIISRKVTPFNLTQLKHEAEENIFNNPIFQRRCEYFGKALDKIPGWHSWLPSIRAVNNLIYESGDSILVVSLDGLEDFITSLDATVNNALANVTRVIDISHDPINFAERYTLII